MPEDASDLRLGRAPPITLALVRRVRVRQLVLQLRDLSNMHVTMAHVGNGMAGL